MTTHSPTLRAYLELQADRIEAVLSIYRTPGRVTGGTVNPRQIRFFLSPAPYVRFADIQVLAYDLALALKTPQLDMTQDKGEITLTFANPWARPVTLLDVLRDAMPLPTGSVVLGVTPTWVPVLAHLGHIHIIGDDSGQMLRAVEHSLRLTHRPDILRPVWTNALPALVQLAQTRLHNDCAPYPRVVALLDEVHAPTILPFLLTYGERTGVHLVISDLHPPDIAFPATIEKQGTQFLYSHDTHQESFHLLAMPADNACTLTRTRQFQVTEVHYAS